MNVGDARLIAAFLLCAGLIAAGLFFLPGAGSIAAVKIIAPGKPAQTVALPESPRLLVINAPAGALTVLLEKDGVSVISADCPLRSCVKTGKITKPGQSIVCLPNRVLIAITGKSRTAKSLEVDAVAK